MNFFEQQDRAQRNTSRLIILLGLAVLSLIAITTFFIAALLYYGDVKTQPHLQTMGIVQGVIHSITAKMFAEISGGVIAVIVLGSLYKFYELSSGGRAVAEALGGRPINALNANLHEMKILNVVEEMAIASGTPVPPVYVIEDEAMNAFAAGHTPQDAVIGVTRGLIRILNRDELQGVIAHEFSHIFHGDMKLNMRLIALLNGILLLGLIGQFLFRSAANANLTRSSREKSSSAGLMGVGLGLMVIGYAGTFFGNLIKSAVSRQREFLADASAVKFTRNPDGIGGALKKLGGYVGGSQMDIDNAAQFSHLFFSDGSGTQSFLNALATHPPLEERIKRIDPQWDGTFARIDVNDETENSYIKEATENSTYDGRPIDFVHPSTATEFVATVNHVINSIGQPTASHLAYAQQTLTAISNSLHTAAHNPWDAQALILGLLLDKTEANQTLQWNGLNSIYTATQIHSLQSVALDASRLDARLRLALLELSLPALKQLSPPQYQQFKTALRAFIQADETINLVEWCYFKIVVRNLEVKKTVQQLLDLSQVQQDAAVLLSAMAHAGADTNKNAQAAFNSGKEVLDLAKLALLRESDYSITDVDKAVTRLNCLKPLQKPKLLKAISQCILADEKITAVEAELFRAIADALDCPVPPLIVEST